MSFIRAALAAVCLAAPSVLAFAAPPAGLNLSLTCANGNAIWMSSTVQPPIQVVVIAFLSKAAAQQRIQNTELRNGATIDPAYVNNQRVFVQDMFHRRLIALVPMGMTVHLNQQVSVILGHADPGNPCLYTPNLIAP